MTAIIALLGALTGFGLLGVVGALRGIELPVRPSRSASPSGVAPALQGLTVRLVVAVLAGALAAAATGWPVGALAAAVGGFFLPGDTGGRGERARELARMEAIAGWTEMLRDTLAGAGGLEQSIIACAGVAPAAIRAEVLRLAARLERERLVTALRLFAGELNDPTGDLVVAALLFAAENSPKRLGVLLGTLADSARAEVDMRLRVDMGRARTRTAVRIVVIVTAVFVGGLVTLNRSYLHPYDSATGQLVLLLIGVCFGSAFWWLASASRFQREERVLGSVATGGDGAEAVGGAAGSAAGRRTSAVAPAAVRAGMSAGLDGRGPW